MLEDYVGQVWIVGNPLAEMQEEMFQEAATEASSRYAGSRMNSFVGYKLDPESEQEEIGFLNSVFNGIIDTYGDWSSYEAGFSGLFMGAVGSPNFTFSRKVLMVLEVLWMGVFGRI